MFNSLICRRNVAAAVQLELNHPHPEEETDELSLQLTALRQEIEAEEQVQLLNAEDLHLQALKEELEELRKGMQEDLAMAASLAGSSHPTSGHSTPSTILLTPAPSCSGADDTESLYSESRSPLLQTPSPPQHHIHHSSRPEQRRLQAHALSRCTSGTTTPITPHSPLSTTQLSEDGDEAWLAFSSSPPPPTKSFQMAVTPPLPPLTLPVPFAGLDAALTAAFEEGSLDLDDWENEEEWLVKTARGTKKTNTKNQEMNRVAGVDVTTPASLIVRPLPKVQIPRLNLSIDGVGTPRGGPVTFSARGGIKNYNNKSSATTTAKTSGQHTARRQGQLTSRTLSHSSNATAASMGTPRTERRSSSNTSPSGSLTARRSKAVSFPSTHSPSLTTTAAAVRGGTVNAGHNENSPSLFSKSMSAGAAARRDAPTPRLVLGAALVETNSTTPNKKTAVVTGTTITDKSINESGDVDARPPTKIPRLQLPLN